MTVRFHRYCSKKEAVSSGSLFVAPKKYLAQLWRQVDDGISFPAKTSLPSERSANRNTIETNHSTVNHTVPSTIMLREIRCLPVLCRLQMDQEIEERHRREVEAAESKKSAAVTDADEPEEGAGAAGAAEDRSAAGGGLSDKLEGMSVEDREKGKRDQKRAKAQRKRDKQREKVCLSLLAFFTFR